MPPRGQKSESTQHHIFKQPFLHFTSKFRNGGWNLLFYGSVLGVVRKVILESNFLSFMHGTRYKIFVVFEKKGEKKGWGAFKALS